MERRTDDERILYGQVSTQALYAHAGQPSLLLEVVAQRDVAHFPVRRVKITQCASVFRIVTTLDTTRFRVLGTLVLRCPVVYIHLSATTGQHIQVTVAVVQRTDQLASATEGGDNVQVEAFIGHASAETSLEFRFQADNLTVFGTNGASRLAAGITITGIFHFDHTFIATRLQNVQVLEIGIITVP